MISLYILMIGIIYILLAIFVTFWITSRFKEKFYQILVFIISVSIFILVPTWDIIPGKFYFNKLCETEGGIKVFNTKKLPDEYWDMKGNVKRDLLSEEINTISKVDDESQNIFRIRKTEKRIIDKNTSEVLGAYTYFIYFGGWLKNNSGLHVTGISCPPIEQSSYSELLEKVFVHN